MNLPFDFPEDASKLFDLAMKQLKLGDIDGAASMLSASLQIEERPATFFELAKLKFQRSDYPAVHYHATRAIEMARELKLEPGQSEPYVKLLAEIQPLLDAQVEMERIVERLANDGDLHGLFQVFDLLKFEDAMMQIARPSLRMILKDDPTDKAASKIGGWPILPDDVSWPSNADGLPLAFLCRIDLGCLAGTAFSELTNKKTGYLSFFYDAVEQPFAWRHKDRYGWKVLFTPSGVRLCYPEEPEGLSEDCVFKAYSVSFEEELTFPLDDCGSKPEMTSEEEARFNSLCSAWYGRHSFEKHRLFGCPQLSQDGWELECQLAANSITHKEFEKLEPLVDARLTDSLNDWILLLQLDSFYDAAIWWQNGVKLCFCIHKDDLTAGDFDKVWVVVH
ncbi:MAG: YwqG family protein [Candidatus Obscuribacterales bacterium]